MIMSNSNNNNNVVNGNSQFGDTMLTKVFVGGLAWETPKEAMKEHFHRYGEILVAVIISNKVTGRSKGYGFAAFKDPEAAEKACGDATPVINGHCANRNLSSLGACRLKSSPQPAMAATTTPPPTTLTPLPHQGSIVIGVRTIPTTAANPQAQWYYPSATPPLPYHHLAIPLPGYSPTYIAADITYNQKLSYNGGGGGGGAYIDGHHTHHHHHHVYPSHTMLHANTLVPMYPHHQHHHHHPYRAPTTVELPAHIVPTTAAAAGPISTVPATLSN